MTDLPLEQLREYRSCNAPIVRGSIQVLVFNKNYLIEKIILSVLIFVFSVVIGGEIFGSKIGIIIGAFFVSLYLFWPIYYVKYIEHKTKQKDLLRRF